MRSRLKHVAFRLQREVGLPRNASARIAKKLNTLARSVSWATPVQEEGVKVQKAAGTFVMPELGKVGMANRKARMGRSPQTGEAMRIPAKTVVKFRSGKAFKDAVVPPKKK